ncbi:MAG: hypothetical protein HY269_06665, partial [Deltaproteobacteria bacterium]|nr:hypothetical protein [Deltaproteobacteria bacterium]
MKWLAALGMCVSACSARCQPVGNNSSTITHGPGGTSWVHTFPGVRVFACQHVFNWSDPRVQDSVSNGGDWWPPVGTEIVDCRYKLVLQNGNLIVLVLLNNGTVVRFELAWGGRLVNKSIGDVAATGEQYMQIVGDALYAYSGHGTENSFIHVSRDDAKTWSLDTTGLGDARVRSMAVDTNQNVYAATTQGLISQTPTGTAWTPRSLPLTAGLSAVFVDQFNHIYVADTLGGVCVSSTGGTSWSQQSIAAGRVIRFESDSLGAAYAIASMPAGLFKFSGTSWVRFDQALGALVGPFVSYADIDIQDGVMRVATSAGVFRSLDNGTSWQDANSRPAVDVHAVASAGSALFMSTDLGLFRGSSTTPWLKVLPMLGYQSDVKVSATGANTVCAVM